jgi:sterol O-acyltransferase
MKQHSYAFYTGWLSNEFLRQQRLEKELLSLEIESQPLKRDQTREKDLNPLGNNIPSATDSPAAAKHGSPGFDPVEHDTHPSGLDRTSSLVEERERLLHEIDATERDLTGKVLGRNKYPNNLTFANFLDYMLCPTLVYELEYPRTDKYEP